MSWDIFVMDIPLSATSVDTVPSDWVPGPIPMREEILERLKLRAFDPGSATGIFDPATASESLARWREYRAQMLKLPSAGE